VLSDVTGSEIGVQFTRQAIDVTPTKLDATNTGCALRGFEENYSRRRMKLNGKVFDL